jgi:hypothetical protein
LNYFRAPVVRQRSARGIIAAEDGTRIIVWKSGAPLGKSLSLRDTREAEPSAGLHSCQLPYIRSTTARTPHWHTQPTNRPIPCSGAHPLGILVPPTFPPQIASPESCKAWIVIGTCNDLYSRTKRIVRFPCYVKHGDELLFIFFFFFFFLYSVFEKTRSYR